jgi:hypothetical protein
MPENLKRFMKPRCYLVYALAPESLPAADANRIFNAFIADRRLPLVVFHDHFIGRAGGVAIFYIEDERGRDALLEQRHLDGWHIEYRPMIFSSSPAAFDEQVAFTLKAYRGLNWELLQKEKRPRYGDPGRESEPAEEE